MKTRWKFLIDGMRSANGGCVWEKGKWKHHEGKLEMCSSGFHCSRQVWQAFSYISGQILVKVEVNGKSESQQDKEVWSDMRVIKAWKWQKKDSVALAVYAAKLCIFNFEKQFPEDKRPRLAIDAAERWIENPTEENRSAACAAYSAARAADNAACVAYRAADSAADSVAREEMMAKIERWLMKRITQLEEI